MTKQDWLDYFEAVNGRSATELEVAQAIVNGEISADSVSSVYVDNTSDGNVNQQSAVGSTDSFNNVSSQQVYNVQVAVPSSFSVFLKQFWAWLVAAWKRPTSAVDSQNKYNSLIGLGLQAFFAALTLFYTVRGIGNFMTGLFSSLIPSELTGSYYYGGQTGFSLGLPVFFRLFAIVVFFQFSIIFAAFIVKRFIYKEVEFTFKYSFDWFGSLSAITVPIFGSAFVLSVLGVYSLEFLLFYIGLLILPLANVYTISQMNTDFKTDKFYVFALGWFLNGLIVFLLLSVGLSFMGQMFISSLF